MTLLEMDNLQRLQLSGNQLIGCVPAGLLSLKFNDLSSLGLPTCTAEQLCANDANHITVPGHAEKPGLVSDCAALMDARDTLLGTSDLDWKYGLSIYH